MENRSRLVVAAVVTQADGYGERAAALAMLDTLPDKHRKTFAADKGYDTRDFEEHFGWGKTVGRIRQTVYRGLQRVDQQFKLTMTAGDIVRMARMLGVAPQGALR